MSRKLSREAVLDWIRLRLVSAIDTPATGYGYLGVKSDKHLYFKDADSLETDLMAGGAGSDSDHVIGPSSATSNAVSLFNGTSGKIIKNSTATYDSDGFNIASGLLYKINGVAHTHAESEITFTDNTTNNASSDEHGYLPKLSGDSDQYLNGDGQWTVPSGSSGSTFTDYSSTSTVTGWTTPTKFIWIVKVGRLVTIMFSITGTSNTTTVSFTVPDAVNSSFAVIVPTIITDNGTTATAVGRIRTTAGSATISVDKAANASDGWTNSGTKTVRGTFSYITD